MRVQSVFVLRSAARRAIGVALAAVASAACGSSTSAPAGAGGGAGAGTSTTTGKHPCQLMARADAETAVGQPLSEMSEIVTLGMCQYTTADFTAGAALTVSDWDSIKAAAMSGPHPPVAVAGVGDEALDLNGANGSNLYVRKGSQGFLLVLNGPKIDPLPDHGLAQEKVLAGHILANF